MHGWTAERRGRRGPRWAAAAMVASLVALTVIGGSASAATAAAACTGGFKPVQVRDLDGRWKAMGASSVAVVPGSSQAWATRPNRRSVRDSSTGETTVRSDILHFDGTRWAPIAQSADERYDYLILNDIYARSPSDVWAVGWGRKRLGVDHQHDDGYQPLVEHWDGREWTTMPTPRVPINDEDVDGGHLTDVVALAPDNVWAIGRAIYDYETQTQLIYHWNGSTWTSVASAALGDRDRFNAVIHAPYSSTAWFLGEWMNEAGYGPLLQRYKSGAWTEPLALDVRDLATAGVALSWDDIWAVGGGGPDGSALTMHKNASGWSVVPTPEPASGQARLHSVAAVSSSNVWAVGNAATPSDDFRFWEYRPLIEHWDGSSWSIVPTPLEGTEGTLNDIALRKSGWGWVVGQDTILQACGI